MKIYPGWPYGLRRLAARGALRSTSGGRGRVCAGTAPEIVLAEPRGFCAGVERALRKVEEALATGPFPVRALHEIVHNETAVEELKRRGVEFIDDPGEAEGGTLIISAHGVGRAVEERAAGRPVKLVDATCPIVKNLQQALEKAAGAGKAVILFGRRGHREVEGLLGRAGKASVTVIESAAALERFLKEADPGRSYACFSQTTLNAAEVGRLKERVRQVLPRAELPAAVCFATRDRQNAVRELAKTCGVILVVGSRQSSNTVRLYEIARECGARAYLLPDAAAYDPSWTAGARRIGVTSGASAPEQLVRDLRDAILRRA